MKCNLLIIDTSNVLYTVAQRGKGNVLVSTIKKISSYVDKFNPRVLVIGNDLGSSSYRKDLLPAYKEGREEKKKAFKADTQKRMALVTPIRKKLKQLFKGLAIDSSIYGVEFDDVASLLTHQFEDSIIVTSDKDMLQCPARVYSPYHNKFLTAEEKFGVSQDQVPFALALIGDVADNIKGLKGVGEGTVPYVVKKYGSFEALEKADIESEPNHHVRDGLRNLPNFDWKKTLDLVTTFTDTSKLNPEQLEKYKQIEEACRSFEIEWDFDTSANEREEIFEAFGAFGGQTCLDDLAMRVMV